MSTVNQRNKRKKKERKENRKRKRIILRNLETIV